MSKPLGELAEVYYGKSPTEVLTDESPIPIIGTGGVYGRASRPMFSVPAVVVPRKGSLGNPQYVSEPFWPVDTTYALIPKNGVDAKWLYYSLVAFDLTKLNEATGVPSISREWLYKVPLDSTEYSEQRRIAEILSTLDETIEKTEALIAKYQQIKAGLMHDLFTRGVTPDGKLRPTRAEGPQLYIQSPLGWIPGEWEEKKLGECFTLQRGFDITQEEQTEGTVPVVSSSGVTSLHSVAMCQGPGVVIGRKGKLGNAYYLDGPHWPHDTTLWVKDFHGNDPRFTCYFLLWMRLDRFDAATSVPTLNRNFIHPMLVAIAKGQEQEKIVSRLDAVQNFLNSIDQDLKKLKQQKHGLMHDLLTGRVRVKVEGG